MDLSKQKLYSIGEAANILGVSITTLRRWDRQGKIAVARTPTGNRVFTEFDLLLLKKSLRPSLQKSDNHRFHKPSILNFKYISVSLIVILLVLNLLQTTPYPHQAVLGVETFVAPALEESAPLGNLLGRIGNFFKGLSIVVPFLGKSEFATEGNLER